MKTIEICKPEGGSLEIDTSNPGKLIIKVKEAKKLPESWEDLKRVGGWKVEADCEKKEYTRMGVYCTSDNKATWPTEKEADASIALAQLTQLRDAYNGEPLEGWCGYSNSDQLKMVVSYCRERLHVDSTRSIRSPLAFKTAELARKFISCPKIMELLEIAKPLL